MGYIEEATKDLYNYLPPLTRKDDFDAFWTMTIEEAKAVPLQPERTKLDYPSRHVHVYDIAYNGMDETRIRGWLLIPAFLEKTSYPCLIHYHGFTGSRGEPSELMHWVMMGMAVLAVDCRDQGGATGNGASYTHGFLGNVASKGVHNKQEYYYRYAYMDALKAIDFAAGQAEIDADKIIIEGGSQGGALGMAVAALDDRPRLAMVDVPSNSNLVCRIEGNHGAFGAVAEYLKRHPEQTDLVMDNLSYVDTMNMADRITCPVLASVALKDETCPAQMYFATYNRITSEKEIVIYPFNGHEGGGARQTEVKLAYLHKHYSAWFEE
ncbi:cephalosporin-C deacetylase [Paenibacillus phyllosphaerae]|uniref:Cephalosporin-C deacetylase n=1 Tax=Paenibacillus phyllosphaerae TaxID=274593 RepID=A0A7W5AXQ4_9BACL|nr:acetylxylan esterase [Paenibacillus phyllosphaerae]MBB3110206.1 cephalosporin-C deacetylase [Paenibacillus phyllosphaerae]